MSVINSKWMDAVDWNSITNKNTIQLLAGEDLSDRDIAIVAMDGNGSSLTAGRVYKADTDVDDRNKNPFIRGVVIGAASSGNTCTLQISGIVNGFSSLTVGAVYYTSATAGVLTVFPNISSIDIGLAVSSTEIYVFGKSKARYREQEFTASGTFYVPAGVNFVILNGCAAGGGGCSGNAQVVTTYTTASGRGGSGGQHVLSKEISVIPDEDITVTIGLAGTGGTGVTQVNIGTTNGNNGVAGGNTSFGSYLTLTGGSGGVANNANGTVAGDSYLDFSGGAVGTSTLYVQGGGGGYASAYSNGGAGSNGTNDSDSSAGTAASSYGAGGGSSGGARRNSGTAVTGNGGNGGGGYLKVGWFE